jgi:hypothetical protein
MSPDDGQRPNEGSAAGGGTPYGQDPYGAPGAYSQQPYGQGAYGGTQPQGGPYGDQYGAGTPSYGPGGERPKKSRAGLIIGLAVVAVIVVIGAVAVVLGTSSGDDKSAAASSSSAPSASAADADVAHMITPPRAFGDYRRLTGSSARRLVQSMRKSASGSDNGTYAEVGAQAKIAIYTKNRDSTHPLVFVGLSSSDSPSIAQELKSRSLSEVADKGLMGMRIGQAKDFPAGTLGGVLRCGTGSVKGTGTAGCMWVDSSTTGMVLVAGTRNVSAVASATLKLRKAAEH